MLCLRGGHDLLVVFLSCVYKWNKFPVFQKIKITFLNPEKKNGGVNTEGKDQEDPAVVCSCQYLSAEKVDSNITFTFLHSCDDRSKVIIQQYHISCVFSCIRTSNTHSNSNVCFFKSRGVIDSISGHGNDCSLEYTKESRCEFFEEVVQSSPKDSLLLAHSLSLNLSVHIKYSQCSERR